MNEDEDEDVRFRTYRAQDIPVGITKTIFDDALKRILEPDELKKLITTLVPVDTHWQTATITPNKGTLKAFARCKPGDDLPEFEIDGIESDLTVDCDFLGMTPLYSSTDPTVDIVAITGLAGHAFGSWRAPKTSKMWLRDFLPEDLPNVRILTYGYNAGLAGSESSRSLRDFAKNLLDSINSVRTSKKEWNRPIIYIGHSIGGLIIKKMLADARPPDHSDIQRRIFNASSAFYFFGVPNKGLNNENFLSLVQGQANEDFIRELKEDSQFLMDLYENFIRGFTFDDCTITSYYETINTKTVEKVGETYKRTGKAVRMVSQTSATWATPKEKLSSQVPIDRDHSQIVKFTSRNDETYKSVRDRIKISVEDAPKSIETRLARLSGELPASPPTPTRGKNATRIPATTPARNPQAASPPQYCDPSPQILNPPPLYNSHGSNASPSRLRFATVYKLGKDDDDESFCFSQPRSEYEKTNHL